MGFEIKEKSINDKISIEVLNLITLCPHRKYDKEDITKLELVYKPGRYRISLDDLADFVKKEIEGREIAMELLPLKILNRCIESTVMQKSPSRYASPEWVEISATSSSKSGAKKFTITTNVKFSREVK